jgi:uncharacterized membrane protein HdeD (DUF308 family)
MSITPSSPQPERMASTPSVPQPDPSSLGAIDDPRPLVPWFFLIGVALIILGAVALAHAALTTTIAIWLFGVLLLIGGVLHTIDAFLSTQWRGYLLHAVAAVTDVVLGLIFILKTDETEKVITLLLAVIYFVAGSMRTLTAALQRFRGWVIVAFTGLLTLLLGACLLADWPYSGRWFIGLCVGVELVLRGCGWIALAWTVRRDAGPVL